MHSQKKEYTQEKNAGNKIAGHAQRKAIKDKKRLVGDRAGDNLVAPRDGGKKWPASGG